MKLLSYLAFLCFLSGLVTVVFALILDRRSPINRTAAIAAALYSYWAFCMTFAFGSDDMEQAYLFYRLCYVCLLFLIPVVAWLFFRTAGVRFRHFWWLIAPFLVFAAIVQVLYFTEGFYFAGFREGPFGNTGIPSGNQFWSSFSPFVFFGIFLAGMITMLVKRSKVRSRRLKGQLTVVSVSGGAVVLLYFLGWFLAERFELPPLEVFASAAIVVGNFYVIVKYRYMRRDDSLVAAHLSQAIQDATVFLDDGGRIVGANPAAIQRFGGKNGNLVGKHASELLDDPGALGREWEYARRGVLTHRYITGSIDGSAIAMNLHPQYDRYGQLSGAVIRVGRLNNFDAMAQNYELTTREREIVLMLVQGREYRDVSDTLAISPGTLKQHMHHIFEKTLCSNRIELFRLMLGEQETLGYKGA